MPCRRCGGVEFHTVPKGAWRGPDNKRRRFFALVQPVADGCHLWKGRIAVFGYGKHGNAFAHRLAWEYAHGPIPDGLWVLHKCDNPPCVNPEHLFLGTMRDNVRDMVAKGRHAHGDRSFSRRYPEKLRRGEQNNRAKLTSQQVAEIPARRAAGQTYRAIGDAFGVTAGAIWHITSGRNWCHLPQNVKAAGEWWSEQLQATTEETG